MCVFLSAFIDEFLTLQGDYWQYIVRIVLAVICGVAIGLERKTRLKDAGVRTHLLVALGSALMMLVSKYGFFDIEGLEFLRADTSRIASQVVSGIGFLGAGLIFVKKQTITGLTTAAGVWATAGVGLAIGSGMYVIGIFATIAIILTQTLLHGERTSGESLTIEIGNRERYLESLTETLKENKIEILSMHIEKTYDDSMHIEMSIKMPAELDRITLLAVLREVRGLHSLDF